MSFAPTVLVPTTSRARPTPTGPPVEHTVSSAPSGRMEEGLFCLAASVGPLQATLVIWYNQYQKTTQLDELRRSRAVSAPEDASSKSYDRFQLVPHFHIFTHRRTSKSALRSIFFFEINIFYRPVQAWRATNGFGTRPGALASGAQGRHPTGRPG